MTATHFPGQTFLLIALLAGCNGKSQDSDSGTPGTQTGTTPTVVSNTPANNALDVLLNSHVSATFSEEMNGASFDSAGAFTVTSGLLGLPVLGTVIYADSTATFWPEEHLAADTVFTATVTTATEAVSGAALAGDFGWTFTTGTDLGPGLPVPLGTAGDYAVLAKSGISSVPPCTIMGDVGLSPAAASYITGFSLTADASNRFSSSTQVVGSVFASDYTPPTPTSLTTAVEDMMIAYTDAAGRAPDVTELGAGNIGGMTLTAGVYKWGTGLVIPTDVTLTGSPTDVWIFEVAQDLTVSSGVSVSLSGGAKAKNVFWQVAGSVDLGTTSHMEGIVMTQTAVTMRTGASVAGRVFAQTAVEMDSATVTQPAP